MKNACPISELEFLDDVLSQSELTTKLGKNGLCSSYKLQMFAIVGTVGIQKPDIQIPETFENLTFFRSVFKRLVCKKEFGFQMVLAQTILICKPNFYLVL